jgi:cytochrome b pre-mRNA-processing protein 3
LLLKSTSAEPRNNWLSRFGRRPRGRDQLLPLYRAVVAVGRDPFFYRDGQVPDTVDGRFNMIAAIVAILLVRMEADDGDQARHDSVMLTELFIEDMDESLRQIGIGDYVVGKHVGKMMGALGGRLAAFRQASLDRGFEGPVSRNIYHENPPSPEALTLVTARLEAFDAALARAPLAEIVAGKLPQP